MRLILILAMAMVGTGVQAATILWDRNPTNDNVSGYRVYQGILSRNYTNVVDVGNVTNWRVRRLYDTNYFAVTAYRTNDNLESDYSAEVTYIRPPYTNAPRPITLYVPTNKWWIVSGPVVTAMTNWFSVTGPTNITIWSTNGPSMFLARTPFYTALKSMTAKGGAGALMTKAVAAKPKKKAAVKSAPVLGPPAPAPSPPMLPSPTRTK